MKASQGRRGYVVRLSMASLMSSLGLAGVSAGTAHAAAGCGATVREDTVLTESLDCRQGDGLTLAPGVTLDLGGHSITGVATGQGLELEGGNTVKNGQLKGFGTAVRFMAGDPSQLSAISTDGAVLVGGRLSVKESVMSDSSLSVGGGALDISDSTLSAVRLNAQVGGVLTVQGSTLSRSPLSFNRGSIRVSGSLLDGEQAALAPLTGTYAGSAQVTQSTVRGFKRPMSVSGGSLMVRDVIFEDNSGGAVSSAGANYNGSSITVADSTFRRNGTAVTGGPMGRLAVSGSKFENGATGILVMDPADTSVMGNSFTDQSDSGVRVQVPAAGSGTNPASGEGFEVGSNRAVGSGQYGLFVPGAQDRGGNVARGNGVDCVGVTCAQD